MQTSKKDFDTIREIAERATRLSAEKREQWCYMLDVEIVHKKTPLRLSELLAADNGNFMHDVFGIARHLNRETLHLENCFVPRFTA